MATILEALAAGNIRYARGEKFAADDSNGSWLYVTTPAEIPALLQSRGVDRGYQGAVFVGWDEELPPSVMFSDPSHCWAEQVRTGTECRTPIGAVVVWTDAATESAENAARLASHVVSAADFHAIRHGTVQ